MVEFAQKLALPAVPDTGADGADIADGEEEQEAQALGGLHRLDEVLHGLRVFEVALEGVAAHDEVVADQPLDRFGAARPKLEAGQEAVRDAGADLAVVAAPPLADVVQEEGQIEFGPRVGLGHQRHRERVVFLQGPRLDAA